MKYDGTYGDRAERALAAIADGNSAKLVLAAEGFKTDAEWAEALITQHRVDVNFAKAQRDVAEEKISALPEALLFTLDTAERVCFYEQEFYPMSNFSAFRLRWAGRSFDTSEHAYHWEKFHGHDKHQEKILTAGSAHGAFKYAERHKADRRQDWDAVKVDIMRDILRTKATQHEYVRRKLLESGERELVENSWRDDFWGWGPNRDGQNMLGKLWMEVRAELACAVSPLARRGDEK